MNYYIYRHIRLDTNTPFYIGKGIDCRATSRKSRNNYWKSIVTKCGYKVEIIVSGLGGEDALVQEIKFIKLYKKYGYCEANMTLGGKGSLGWKPSFNWVQNCKNRNTGSGNPMFGKKHNTETIMKMSLKKKGKITNPKPVIDEKTKTIYSTVKAAAIALNVNYSTLKGYLRGEVPNKTSLRFLNPN